MASWLSSRLRGGQRALILLALTQSGCVETSSIGVPERIPEIVFQQIPERTHFHARKRFQWVCFDRARCRGFFEFELDEIESLLRRRYKQLYSTPEEIPVERRRMDESGERLLGYRGGYVISFAIERLPNGRVRLEHEDYEGELAASWGFHIYEWRGNAWIRVEFGEFVVV